MTKIEKFSINDSVYEQLLASIKNGVWKSGDKLPSEAELCRIFDVSRVSIRAALQRLKGMGLIDVKQGKGAFVCGAESAFDFSSFVGTLTLSEEEMMEIDDIRKMIENKAIEILVTREGNYDFSKLTEEYDALKQAAEECDYDEFTKHDQLFHIYIVTATGNKRLIQMMRIFQDDFYEFLHESNKFLLRDLYDVNKSRQYFRNAFSIHDRIYKAIINRDKKNALSISRSHEELNEERFDWYFSSINSNK